MRLDELSDTVERPDDGSIIDGWLHHPDDDAQVLPADVFETNTKQASERPLVLPEPTAESAKDGTLTSHYIPTE